MTTESFHQRIPLEMAGLRLDKVLAQLFPDYSRSRLQQWIAEGHVLVNSIPSRAKDKVRGGEYVDITAVLQDEVGWQPQALPLCLLYEDEDVLVINKPAGIVVHPGKGNPDHTLVNALLHYAPELAQLPRAGIIHRIDKDTSGVLVVARSLTAHTHLIAQQQLHEFKREYQAVVTGLLISGGTINQPIARHPTQRTCYTVATGGKTAITHYRVIKRYRGHTHIRVHLETGRTHQIRVHFNHLGYSLVGDPAYGGRLKIPPACSQALKTCLHDFPRQALHAEHLGFTHPTTQEFMQWTAPLPDDFQFLLNTLEHDLQHSTT